MFTFQSRVDSYTVYYKLSICDSGSISFGFRNALKTKTRVNLLSHCDSFKTGDTLEVEIYHLHYLLFIIYLVYILYRQQQNNIFIIVVCCVVVVIIKLNDVLLLYMCFVRLLQ